MRTLLAIALVAAFASVAHADDEFDPEGWTLLTKKSLRKDVVRLAASKFTKVDELVVLVTGVDVDAETISVNHTELNQAHEFKDGARAWHLELDSAVKVARLDLTFRKVPRKSRGSISLFARDSTARPAKRAHGMFSTWKSAGWKWLAKQDLDGARRITSVDSGSDAKVAQLVVTASGSDLTVRKLDVTFKDRTHWYAEADVFLGDGAREYTFQLPDDAKTIDSISFAPLISSGTKCQIAFYGRDATEPVEDDGPTWDDDGWTLIGEDDVDLVDDEVLIDREDSTWSMVAVVAVGDDVTLEAVDVHLAGKADKVQRAALDERLTDGSRTRVLEISGKRRAIEKVRLQYKKHKLDASTRVQIYAR